MTDRAGATDSRPLLDIQDLHKSFGSNPANTGISLVVRPGEVVALVGENGAGKSTLMNQVFGLVHPDRGSIVIKGDARPIGRPADAIARGVAMVHQHFQLVPTMTVAENVVLGNETVGRGLLRLSDARALVRDLSVRHGLPIDPDSLIEDLPVGLRQRVEILKVLSHECDLLIFDEPTAVLTPGEATELLGVLRSLARSGRGVVFITHRLPEVLASADRVYVLRRGKIVGHVDEVATVTARDLARLMVGRDVNLRVKKTRLEPGEAVLAVESVGVADDRGHQAVADVSLTVRAGEIVAIAGVEGNGQRELVEAVVGMRTCTSGRVRVAGSDVTGKLPRAVQDAGLRHVPEDRERHGVLATYSIADNLMINRSHEEPFSRRGLRRRESIEAYAQDLCERFDVRAPGIDTLAGTLSGGNKQKLVMARELVPRPPVLIACQPTRGVDVGSIEFIHRTLVEARDAGTGVLLVSADLDEVLALADRVLVMHSGRIAAELIAETIDRTEIGRLMAGNPST